MYISNEIIASTTYLSVINIANSELLTRRKTLEQDFNHSVTTNSS